jgi:site-specific recombinase XerD
MFHLRFSETNDQLGTAPQSRSFCAPYIVRDDGTCPDGVNEYFAYVLARRNTTEHLLRYRGRIIHQWISFLEDHRGKSIWDAVPGDIVEFFTHLGAGEPVGRTSPDAWRRRIAVVTQLYVWGHRHGFTSEPLHPPSGFRPPRSAFAGERRAPLPLRDFKLLRDIGFGTSDAVDTSKASSPTRFSTQRDTALLEVILNAGLRSAEALSLRTSDLQGIVLGSRDLCGSMRIARLPKAPAGHVVYLSRRVLDLVLTYIGNDRRRQVERAREAGLYEDTKGWIVATESGAGSALTTNGRAIKWHSLSPGEKSKVLIETSAGDREPALLWLTDRGLPLGTSGWNASFRRAVAQCAQQGVPIEATPYEVRLAWRHHMNKELSECSVEPYGNFCYADPLALVESVAQQTWASAENPLGLIRDGAIDAIERATLKLSEAASEPMDGI